MGVHPNVSYDKHPKQGSFLNRRCKVIFGYSFTDPILYGTIVRDDMEEPFVTIIRLDNGRYVLATECQYSPE